MKALLINSLSAGGAEKVVFLLIQKFYQQNRKIKLICLEKNNFYQVPPGIDVAYLSTYTGKEHAILKLFLLPIFALRLKRLIKKENISLVQSHLYRANYVNIIAKVLKGKQQVQIVNHGIISQYYKEGILGKVNLLLIKRLYPKADLVINVSHGMLHDMKEQVPKICNVKVINNPYDVTKIQQLSNEKIKLQNRINLISVGRLIPLKMNIILLEAFNRLASKFPDLNLIFCGEGEERTKLEKKTVEYGLLDRIIFTGNVNNPFKYIKTSDIFISTSSTEGFPNVIVEALLCGTPIISTDCISGPREILAPASNQKIILKDSIEFAQYGILIPVGSIDCLVDAIKRLLKDKELLTQYKKKGPSRGKEFSIDNIIKQYEEVLFGDQ